MTSTPSFHLRPAEPGDTVMISGWSRSAEETRRWCSRNEHPVSAEVVASWWTEPDVQPWVLVTEQAATPLAYGELWLEAGEDEVELAHLIVDGQRRRTGLGRRLVLRLLDAAALAGTKSCVLRVAPGNAPAISLYRSCGFVAVDEARTAEWNHGQPATYTWWERPPPPLDPVPDPPEREPLVGWRP